MKKILLVAICLLQSLFLFANINKAKYTSEQYEIKVKYNDTIIPGDAIFVRMQISTSKSLKLPKEDLEKHATLQLLSDDKIITESPFYTISKNNKNNSAELLGSIPISMWLEDGKYTLKVIFSPYKNKVKEFIIPTIFQSKEFVKEVINLDERNTAIKTDNSPQRSQQIKKLNDILYTCSPTDIYNFQPFVKPVNSNRITSTFGDRRIYKYSNGKESQGNTHNGIDYGVPEGTEVFSCGAGRVVMAEERISTGWSIVIEHLPGLYSLYYHLSELKVEEGNKVIPGTVIGLSGKTGLATGPHLHWEIRLNGTAVNPEFFLDNFTFEAEK